MLVMVVMTMTMCRGRKSSTKISSPRRLIMRMIPLRSLGNERMPTAASLLRSAPSPRKYVRVIARAGRHSQILRVLTRAAPRHSLRVWGALRPWAPTSPSGIP
eukprot:2846537-Pyramimonas_sp.AAC.1